MPEMALAEIFQLMCGSAQTPVDQPFYFSRRKSPETRFQPLEVGREAF